MMRITNTIIANNSKTNVNYNKNGVDTLNQQMSDQKKIHSPSEDPVIAIRSLRLRGALNQIDQYYTKNIPDAMSWLDITETALTNMKGLIGSVAKQCDYGATDTLEKSDRKVILDDLLETRKQIYTEGNSDYAGRTIFTGWKTQEYLTFQNDDKFTSYDITEKLKPGDIQDLTYINKQPTVTYGTIEEIMEADMPSVTETTRLVLGYNNIEAPVDKSTDPPTPLSTVTLKYTDAAGNEKTINCAVKKLTDTASKDIAYNVPSEDPNSADPSNPTEEFAHYIPETGEIILNNAAKIALRNSQGMEFSYTKTGFAAGELRPEHYYDCKKTIDSDGNEIKDANGNPNPIIYKKETNDIDYTISFNQTIKINTEASDVFDSRMARYIDDMITSLQGLDASDEKIASINRMIEDPANKDETVQDKLKTMLNAATKERDLWDDRTQKLFEENIKVWQDYMDKINLAITDCGSRYARVELTETRMQSQQATFRKLKSTNEDRELSDIIIDFTSANNAYQSSLKATSKALQQSLLDYL